jgi:hypothetical protein
MFDSSAQVRRHIVNALRADLVGPFAGAGSDDAGGDAAEEVWDLAPSKRYLCGFLVPREQATVQDAEDEDPTEAEQLDAGDDPGEESQNDPQAKRQPMLPSSIGLSVLLPAGHGDVVAVRVCHADYVAEQQAPEVDADGKKKRGRPVVHWRRVARPPVELVVPLDAAALAQGTPVGTSGLRIFGQLDQTGHVDGLPPDTRALSLFLVNDRSPVADKGRRDEGYVFQVGLELRHAAGLVARPDLAGRAARGPDDRLMDLQFRDEQSHAAGHGVAVAPIVEGGRVSGARTEWIPEATVKRVTTHEIEGVEVAMERLAGLDSAGAVRAALAGIPAQYGAWLDAERARLGALGEQRAEVAEQVLFQAGRARERIHEGIELLATSAEARAAFCVANRAMAMAARQRSPERYQREVPEWRLFQLAFVLLNLPAIADPEHGDRDTVELIFFPTGGGKTEAYLGVIAFTLVWRRMTGAQRPDRGLGVAVILRYTLRLLTLDQLGRAATLICALEMLRRQQPALGEVRFSLGLWVGKSATANRLSEVARQITDYRNGSTNLSPFPLAACPWCRKEIKPGCMKVEPNQKEPVEVEVGCDDYACDFSPRNGGLPVLFVDEQVYRELPCFLVATVDKFAMLPWRGESGALFGQVRQRVGRMFVGPCTPLPRAAQTTAKASKAVAVKLPEGLRPPELIVQDELHLISGPLGTMVGLYETAIERLACRRRADGTPIKPKLIASTATVKRAVQQIQALYGRDDMAMFPPPGIDDGESFFARVDRNANGRLYVGVAAAGRSMKAVLVTVYAALLSAAQKCADPKGKPGQPCDPYMTLVGYFNNLRELGGMRRLVEDLIRARAASRGELVPVRVAGGDANPWMASRDLTQQPIELTSRESTSTISRSKDLLGKQYLEDGFIPTVLASNMISVGVDIDRLGLMVVAGQPKSTSEYIQASSRVGRDDRRPGLVVTCYNLNKPRDRSYYEHFKSYHECFYRHVEATSVTPFSGPALERGLAGCLIAMTRHADVEMAPPLAAMEIDAHKQAAAAAVQALVERARSQPGVTAHGGSADDVEDELRILAQRVLDRWSMFIAEARAGGAQRCYSPYDVDRAGVPMLHTALDEKRAQEQGMTDTGHFVAPTSMRDVEPTVHLWLKPAGWSAGGGSKQ